MGDTRKRGATIGPVERGRYVVWIKTETDTSINMQYVQKLLVGGVIGAEYQLLAIQADGMRSQIWQGSERECAELHDRIMNQLRNTRLKVFNVEGWNVPAPTLEERFLAAKAERDN